MKEILTSLRVAVTTILVCAVAYPAFVLGFAAVFCPDARHGSLIAKDGTPVGSSLVAQKFTRPEYFWPRPSAVDYDASAAGGSNLSPANPKIAMRTRELLKKLQPAQGQLVPPDLVLASGSGLDPHISRSAVMFQLPRVAAARSLPQQRVMELINRHIGSAPTAFDDQRIVNVLELNLELDAEEHRGE
jgi:potassium-transporting ATPase KdpC subunit